MSIRELHAYEFSCDGYRLDGTPCGATAIVSNMRNPAAARAWLTTCGWRTYPDVGARPEYTLCDRPHEEDQ